MELKLYKSKDERKLFESSLLVIINTIFNGQFNEAFKYRYFDQVRQTAVMLLFVMASF